jgi:hypothetical protein
MNFDALTSYLDSLNTAGVPVPCPTGANSDCYSPDTATNHIPPTIGSTYS